MAETGISDVGSSILADVSATLQSFLIQESKLLPTVTRIPALPGRSSVDLNLMPGLVVGDKSENVAASLQELTTSADTLNFDKEKIVAFAIEDRAREQSMVNLEAGGLERAAKAIALQMDQDIVAQLELTSASGPDHRVAYANSLTDDTLGQEDVLEAKRLLAVQNIEFGDCRIGVGPGSEKNLLLIDNFVHVDKYGANTATANGEIGRLYGAPVIMSNVFDDAKTLFWHPEHVVIGEQRMMKFESDRDILKLSDIYAVHALYGVQVLDGGKRGVMMGTAA